MPSESTTNRSVELTERVLNHLESRIGGFHAAVSAAAREVAEEVERRTGEEDLKGEQALIELGPFAAGRIDPDRFAQLLGVAEAPLTPAALDVLARANDILAAFSVEPGRHVIEVPPGGDLRDAVKGALADFGRAYGAARAVEMARAGTFDEAEHGHFLDPLPYRLWHRAERQLAPPLVVRVRGEDCLPVGLGDFLDGNLVLVLVVEGPTTPAPLARLVTPATFVQQTADPEALVRLADMEHPAVVLLFDEDRPEQAHFVHDPDAGQASWQRTILHRMPSESDVGRGRRVPMWVEELDHLKSLADGPSQPVGQGGEAGDRTTTEADRDEEAATDSGAAPVQDTDPVDRLAAWLLSQADPGEADVSGPGA